LSLCKSQKSVATFIDLRAFHKFILTTAIKNHLYFMPEKEKGTQYILRFNCTF